MSRPSYFANLNAAEHDHLFANSNYYKPGFLQIYLNAYFDGSFSDMDNLQDQGSFLHEYIHYLQNLSTPWGLYTSMVSYKQIIETFAFIQSSHDEILLPIKINCSPSLKRQINVINIGNGESPSGIFKESRKVKSSEKIIWHRSIEKVDGKNYTSIHLDVPFSDGIRTIKLGAYIIKESMAAMYQMQLDPSATHSEDDLPYNIVKILAKQSFPNIADDDKKLISICYISLFSLSPAKVLLEQLQYANEHPNIDGIELLSKFINKSEILINGKDKVSVVDFFDNIADKFEKTLYMSLHVELDYIHEVLTRVRLKNKIVPVLNTLYDPNFGKDSVQHLIDYVGMPYIRTSFNQYIYPKSVLNTKESSKDMIALIGQYAIYDYLVGLNNPRTCPFFKMCSEENVQKDECFDLPWQGNDCIMTIMGDVIGLKNKNIHW